MVKLFDTVDRGFWTTCSVVWCCLGGFGTAILSILPELNSDSSFPVAWEKVWWDSSGLPFKHDLYCRLVPSFVPAFGVVSGG